MNVAESSADEARSMGGRSPRSGHRLIVTIDGPAGTGKSSVARRAAGRLGLFVLDTGAMYRAVAWLAVREDVDAHDEAAVLAVLDRHPVDVDPALDPPRVLVGGVDPGEALRGPEVESIVSTVAALPGVRSRLVVAQQEIARRHPRLVTEGRDQGSVVFPDATARFYLTASASVRAARRAAQLRDEGRTVDPDQVLSGIESRDRLDASRSDGPLVRPDGAVVLDTDRLSLDEVVEEVVATVRAIVPAADLEAGERS